MSSKDPYAKYGLTREIVRHYLPRIAFRRKAKLEQRGNFDEKYPEDVVTAFLVSGNQYFDREVVIARKMELVTFKPYQTFSNGDAVLFHPKVGHRRYLIGADVASGRTVSNEDTDFCAAVVLDLENGEEMAAYHARVTPQDYAFDLADLGRYYNDALISVERTGDGGTTILTLVGDCGYSAVYKHREWFKRDRKKVIEVEGFPTTPKTRPISLNFVNHHILNYPETIWDMKFLDECLTFVRDERGIPSGAPGTHDDRVSARWIAHATRRAVLGWWVPWQSRREAYVSAERITAENPDAA